MMKTEEPSPCLHKEILARYLKRVYNVEWSVGIRQAALFIVYIYEEKIWES